MNTELLKSLIPPFLIIVFAVIVILSKSIIAPALSEFDKEFEDLKSRINVCNDYYTLIQYKFEVKDLRSKYARDNNSDYIINDCTKLLRRLDQKIINNTPVARKVARR